MPKRKTKTTLIDQFLLAYSKDLEWKVRTPAAVMRKLCEEQVYATSTEDNPHNGWKFLQIAYGWFWGASKSSVKANCNAGLLKLHLDEIYKEVAAKNHWE